ncbi:bcl-2 homologous antagonist/killer [Discoglossus pictus]
MATGGSDEPGDLGPELPVDEEKVSAQTEDVFICYSFHMQQLQSGNGDSAPLNAEIEEIRQPNSPLDRVGRQLAFIGDDINRRYISEFDNILKDLNPNLENAYEYFKKIASSLFETGVNWGRILTLLGFGYRMAVYVFRHGHCGFYRTIARWLARYVMESSIASWIARQGGWGAALKLTNNSIKYVIMFLGLALALQFIIKHIS